MSRFDTAPTFSEGQVLSASAHLNALQALVQGLADAYLGQALPFGGVYPMGGDTRTYSLLWTGYIRHKYDALDFRVVITAGSDPVYVKVNALTVATLSGAGTHIGAAVGLDGLGLTVDQFYPVTVETDTGSDAVFYVELLSEHATLTLPALAAFADDATPSAAEWQDLSTYAEALAAGLTHPLALVTQNKVKLDGAIDGPTAGGGYPFRGTLNHRARWLAYRLALVEPFWRANWDGNEGSNTGARWTRARLYIGATLVATWVVGREDVEPGDCLYHKYYSAGQGAEHIFDSATDGEIDLDASAPGLTIGADYGLYLHVDDSTYWDVTASANLLLLYATPATAATLAGWEAFVNWTHGLYVYGSSSGPRAGTLKANLETLGAVETYHNYPARACIDDSGDGGNARLYGVRGRRWLHHKQRTEDAAPVLHYTYNGEEKDVTLNDSYTAWQAHDLDSAPGLFVGTAYYVDGALYALEDSVA